MVSNDEMIDCFSVESLVYAHQEKLENIEIPDMTKEFISNTGFPHVVSYFRFSMDFEPLSTDPKIGESVKHLGKLFTIGCQGASQLIGRFVHLSEIGLSRNSSLSDIGKKIRELEIDDAIFCAEVAMAPRMCIDLENSNQIVLINPLDLSIAFLNSSIQKLASSIVAYQRNFLANPQGDRDLVRLAEELKHIDIQIFDSPNTIWMQVIEALERDAEGYS